MSALALGRSLLGKTSPFDAIPGSDSLLELPRLLRHPRRFFHERFAEHGQIFKTRLVFPAVFLVGAEANRTVMITKRAEFSFGRGYYQTAVRRVFEGSIMLQDGEDHARTRGILSPVVGRLAIRESAEQVNAIWSRRAEALRDGKAHDVYEVAEHGTFDAAANALSGFQLGPETDRFRPEFESLIEGIMAPTPYRIPFGVLDRALNARERLIDMLRPRIEAARQRDPEGLVGQLAHWEGEDGSRLSAEEIAGHLLLLMWAGYDTTASAGSWILYVLARRPDWQARLRDELAEHIGDDIGNIEGSRDLKQLDRFLYEVERMYPSALFFPRIAIEDIEFQGYTIPKGTPTFYSPYLSHRDPASFDNPNAFDPDRWDPSGPGTPPRKSLLVGFGGGPRVCLGKAFAKMQLKLMIHAMLSRYRLEPDPLGEDKVMGLPVHHPVNSRVFFHPLH